MSPALAGRFLIAAPPGKSHTQSFFWLTMILVLTITKFILILCPKKCFNCSCCDFKDCQQKCKKKSSVVITWMSLDFYTKVLKSCRTLLESVQKPDLETIIDKVVKIYDALMYIQGEHKKPIDQNNLKR